MSRPRFPELTGVFFVSTLVVVAGACDRARACVPDPARSSVALSGNGSPCQFNFRSDGSLDVLVANVTLRDGFDVPVESCSISAEIQLLGGKPASDCWAAEPGQLCGCESLDRGGVSDENGVVSFEWPSVGGRGVARVVLLAHCCSGGSLGGPTFNFTSHDLISSCTSSSTVLSLAVWVSCFPPSAPCQSSDYNCDCVVNVLDFGIWAGGIGRQCP